MMRKESGRETGGDNKGGMKIKTQSVLYRRRRERERCPVVSSAES
jgi:hypothetical protein